MPALPFELFGFTQYIENQPEIMVFVATFGLLAVMFIMMPFMYLPFLKSFLGVIAGSLLLVLFPGFIMTIIFAFSGVSGIHTLLSWLVLVLASIFFVAFNYSRLMVYIQEFGERGAEKPQKIKMGNTEKRTKERKGKKK